MGRQRISNILLLCSATAFVMSGLAHGKQGAEDSIYSTSIHWEDEVNKKELLASVPIWEDDTIQAQFDVFSHPEKFALKTQENDSRYSAQFINVHWGPKNNPFDKVSRPAKAFVFVGNNVSITTSKLTESAYVMAPLIKNKSDGNYYVFDKRQSRPILLTDWYNSIMASQHGAVLRFNVCDGYANVPSDSCHDTSYQSEVAYIQSYANPSVKLNYSLERNSAHRDLVNDWKIHAYKVKKSQGIMSDSILSSSISWDNDAERVKLLLTTSAWADFKTIRDNFIKIRDIRYFEDEESPGFQRRITWLYPDDGCWTRASAVIRDLFGPFNNTVNIEVRPSKVFVFGNLCANTPNSPSGQVSWWYHTAPVIRDAQTNQTYVLDPSVNSSEPLTIEQWVKDITSNTGACAGGNNYIDSINICNGYGATPYNQCNDAYENETDNMLMQNTYRYYERSRQTELDRDPDSVLGDSPPWH